MTKKIVPAYSGNLDTPGLPARLQEKYRVPIVAFLADAGQGGDRGAL